MPGIVSLLPSATEWVYALGLQHRLTAVTFECDEPATARRDHRVVVTGLDTDGLTPAQIDALVRDRAARRLPMYTLDERALADLAPDVVLTQDLCAVCALPAGSADEALLRAGCPAQVVTLDPHRLDDVLQGATAVADAAGEPDRGRRLLAVLRGRLDAVAEAVANRTSPRVLVLEWTDPPFVAGHWVPDLVAAAGGVPVLATPGGRSTTTTWAAVADEPCDAVLVAPCGYGLDDATRQAHAILDRLDPAVTVWAIDAGGLVTRPGPRVVDAVEAIAAALHPDAVAARPAATSIHRVKAGGSPQPPL